MGLKYRADIQVLRGIAVLLVVIFHISPKIMPSGFFGVDIFFVISGFLMCSLYSNGSRRSLISSFYQRRFSRLIPAYFTTITVCVVFGSYILIPYEFSVLLDQALASLIGIPNILLWSGESYFDEFAFRPLLHLWSLGVEIQFYLIVPLVYFLISRSRTLFLILMVGSFFSCLIVSEISSKTAFFMLPFRMWEFLIGFAVAYYFSDSGNIKTDRFGLYGLFSIIALSFFSVFPLEIGPHPGMLAFVVCILTAAVLLVGLPLSFLSTRFSRFFEVLGKYSYSIYLVHFPVLIFIYHEPFGGEVIDASLDIQLLFAITLIITLSLSLYYLVENRRWMKVLGTSKVMPIGLFLLVLLVPPVGYAINNKSHTTAEKEITSAPLNRSFWRCGKYEKFLRVVDSNHLVCNFTNSDSDSLSSNILLVGDSHADAVKQSVANVSNNNNAQLYFMIESCNLGVSDCQVDKVIEIVKMKNIDRVIIHDFYKNIRFEKISDLLSKIDGKDIKVYYLDPIPVYPYSVPAYLLKEHNYGYQDIAFHRSRAHYELKYKSIHEKLDKLGVVRIPTLESLCDPGCQTAIGKVPIYADSHHLTLTGAKKLEPVIGAIMFPE